MNRREFLRNAARLMAVAALAKVAPQARAETPTEWIPVTFHGPRPMYDMDDLRLTINLGDAREAGPDYTVGVSDGGHTHASYPPYLEDYWSSPATHDPPTWPTVGDRLMALDNQITAARMAEAQREYAASLQRWAEEG